MSMGQRQLLIACYNCNDKYMKNSLLKVKFEHKEDFIIQVRNSSSFSKMIVKNYEQNLDQRFNN